MSKSRQPKKPPQVADEPEAVEATAAAAPGPLDAARPDDNEVTSYKAFKRDTRLLGKISALLDKSQPETLAHFRRTFEDLYFTLLAAEQRKMQHGRRGDAPQ